MYLWGMDNRKIAEAFQELGQLMELHGENPFKTKSYLNAYLTLKKLDQPLAGRSAAELANIKGVGSAIASKILELLEHGQMATLEKYRAQTPEGVRAMLDIAGLGPKKVVALWKELHLESPGELLYACNENRLVTLKGFGPKTQEEIKKQVLYYLQTQNDLHFANVYEPAADLLEKLRSFLPGVPVEFTGKLRRQMPVLDVAEFLIGAPSIDLQVLEKAGIKELNLGASKGIFEEVPVQWHCCSPEVFGNTQFQLTGPEALLPAVSPDIKVASEGAIFTALKIPFVPPACRDIDGFWATPPNQLIEEQDLKGILHNHSDWSDGSADLDTMAQYVRDAGYEYFGISDHSQAAFYANGLSPERVQQQWQAIDALNDRLAPFKIYKSIEADILNDGTLDYEEELLRGFDFVIASVHSNLRMDSSKATARLIKAIEHPCTRILGHPTGRLLLGRQGYPVDMTKVLDACKANSVVVEINANPWRLDLDYTWIPAAMDRGILLSINPDAHSLGGIHHVKWGVMAAQKGGLTREFCLNSKSLNAFEEWVKNRV